MISRKEVSSSEPEKNATTASPLADFCLIQPNFCLPEFSSGMIFPEVCLVWLWMLME